MLDVMGTAISELNIVIGPLGECPGRWYIFLEPFISHLLETFAVCKEPDIWGCICYHIKEAFSKEKMFQADD